MKLDLGLSVSHTFNTPVFLAPWGDIASAHKWLSCRSFPPSCSVFPQVNSRLIFTRQQLSSGSAGFQAWLQLAAILFTDKPMVFVGAISAVPRLWQTLKGSFMAYPSLLPNAHLGWEKVPFTVSQLQKLNSSSFRKRRHLYL